jgi:AcrR family transcriptional regulator
VEKTEQQTRRTRTAARQQGILDAALDCFIENGFEGTSLRQIAVRAHMTHAGLLHHFKSKEALVAALLQRRDEQDENVVKQVATETTEHNARAPALFELLAHHRESPGEMRFWGELCAAASRPGHPSRNYYAARYDSIRTLMQNVFRRRAEAGSLREGAHPELIAMLLPAVLDGLQSQWLLDRDLPIDRALDHFLSLFLQPDATLDEETAMRGSDRSVSLAAPVVPPRAVVRRQQILAAAIELFSSRGFGETAISEVAAKAGCSKASVLYHFATKDELLHAALQPLNAAFGGLVAKLRSAPPANRTNIGVPALINLCVQHRSLMALMAVLPRDSNGGALMAAWADGSVVEMVIKIEQPRGDGIASFVAAAIPAVCRQSASLTDQMLREHLTAALSVLLRDG